MDDYFDQITAEKVVYRTSSGLTRRVYQKIAEDIRNEALDCEVYAAAAWEICNVSKGDIDRTLAALAEQVGRVQGPVTAPLPTGTPAKTRRMRSSGINSK